LEKISKKKKKKKLEKEKVDLFKDLDSRGKMFAIYVTLNLSFSSFNFCNLFLNYLCNFSTNFFSALILETKNIETCLWKMKIKNHSSVCCLLKHNQLIARSDISFFVLGLAH
jgi:hypothetical protein